MMFPVKLRPLAVIAALCLLILAGCDNATPAPDATPTLTLMAVNFPRQAPLPGNVELAEDQLLLSGGLYVSSTDGCLRFREDTGEGEYTPVWPFGYSPATDPVTSGIMVINSDGKLAARTGVSLSMSGTEMSPEDYEVLFGEPLQTECEGPFWIVTQVFNASPE